MFNTFKEFMEYAENNEVSKEDLDKAINIGFKEMFLKENKSERIRRIDQVRERVNVNDDEEVRIAVATALEHLGIILEACNLQIGIDVNADEPAFVFVDRKATTFEDFQHKIKSSATLTLSWERLGKMLEQDALFSFVS